MDETLNLLLPQLGFAGVFLIMIAYLFRYLQKLIERLLEAYIQAAKSQGDIADAIKNNTKVMERNLEVTKKNSESTKLSVETTQKLYDLLVKQRI